MKCNYQWFLEKKFYINYSDRSDNLINSNKEVKWCYGNYSTQSCYQQIRDDGVIMKWHKGDEWKVYESIQSLGTDDYNANVYTLLTEKNICIAPPPYSPHL